jgi:hypothetical protein
MKGTFIGNRAVASTLPLRATVEVLAARGQSEVAPGAGLDAGRSADWDDLCAGETVAIE